MERLLNQVGGEMKSVLSKWRNDLLRCLAYVEAVMDFGEDESDVREDEVLKHGMANISLFWYMGGYV